MSVFIDTSMLCARYREQDNSEEANKLFSSLKEPIWLSSFVIFEFRQAIRLQLFQYTHNHTQGCSKSIANDLLLKLEEEIRQGILSIISINWNDVHSLSERLSAKYTSAEGHRIVDVMHVATALHCKADIFLTLDAKQRKLAQAVGLKIKP